MGFRAVDEIEQFSFDDCQITKYEAGNTQLLFELEALVVRRNNSQNTNFTESYAGTTTARFINGKIISGVKDGYKYYDANETLVEEVPDTKLSPEEIENVLGRAEGAYLYFMERDSYEDGVYCYTMGIEFADATDGTMAESYTLRLTFEKSIFEWERYMNRLTN